MRIWAAVLCGAVCCGAEPAQVRDAIQRAVALMQKSQEIWYSKQTCNSCHHQYQPAIAFNRLRLHGFAVQDRHFPAEDTDLDRAVQYNYVIEPAMDDAYRLVAQSADGRPPNLVGEVYARLIAARQYPDGHWESFHQRPPQAYSRFTQTALGLRAIQLASHPRQKADADMHVALARTWLMSNKPGTTEERTYQLLGLLWAGEEQKTLNRLASELAAFQHADGGWSSLDNRPSDAYSTGEALVALQFIPRQTDAAQGRGIEFLLKTQAADGSWHVSSRLNPPASVSPPYFDSGYPGGHDQFLSITASSWAIMALAETLGRPEIPHVKTLLPFAFDPWAETVLFGAVGDVKRLLDNGFDPNSATAGGTTALMMAAPDVDKMKLLIDRGANVSARAKSGYTALMVAAQYRDSSAAINFLLDHGAQVRPPAGQPAPLFNAHPLFLAAYAGNAGILKRLKDAGGSIDAPMDLIGNSRTTPLQGAVRFGDLAVARTLLELGARVDELDGSGMTPLGRAALGNQVEMAEFLIDRGADVNHVDKLGMTPLLYATSIDFGDSAMIELLVKSGARIDAKTKEGLTALDLARKYQYQRFIPFLGLQQ